MKKYQIKISNNPVSLLNSEINFSIEYTFINFSNLKQILKMNKKEIQLKITNFKPRQLSYILQLQDNYNNRQKLTKNETELSLCLHPPPPLQREFGSKNFSVFFKNKSVTNVLRIIYTTVVNFLINIENRKDLVNHCRYGGIKSSVERTTKI